MRILCSILLLLNGIGALYGGYSFIIDPSGKLLGANISWLEASPFTDFLIPGIILFIVLGVGSVVTAIFTIFHIRHYIYLLIAIGTGIIIWILTQIAMIQMLYFLQYIIGGIGLVVLICGLVLRRRETNVV